ncbi:MAG TPA: hypothetical protein VIH37_13385 [Candidatus Limnocylindrales bacterium]
MSFLRRVLGGASAEAVPPVEPAQAEAEDAARDAELLREDARRLSDDLIARQIRYADRCWTPPAQGGSRRADDAVGTDSGQG